MFKMKRLQLCMVLMLLMTLVMVPVAQADQPARDDQVAEITIIVNGSIVSSDVKPVIINGTTLVPMRVIEDALGVSLNWDESLQTLTVVKGDIRGTLIIGSYSASIKIGEVEKQVNLTQPAKLIQNRVMAPIRFISELFNAKVVWNTANQSISISTQSSDDQELKGSKGDPGEKGDKGDPGATGPAGTTGPAGATGPQGDKGDKGDLGATGPAGTTGPAGATGPQGDKGDKGDPGATGPAGATGPQGDKGDKGDPGATGPAGATGPQGDKGDKGDPGDPGPAGGMSEYAYVYNLMSQVVAIEADVKFDTIGIITPGLSHTSGSSEILVSAAGDYEISFSVSAVEPNQFALFNNGTVVQGSVYGSGAGTQQNNGHVIVTLAAGDVITLRNHSSAAAVTLQTLNGGTQINVNASLLIKKLN